LRIPNITVALKIAGFCEDWREMITRNVDLSLYGSEGNKQSNAE